MYIYAASLGSEVLAAASNQAEAVTPPCHTAGSMQPGNSQYCYLPCSCRRMREADVYTQLHSEMPHVNSRMHARRRNMAEALEFMMMPGDQHLGVELHWPLRIEFSMRELPRYCAVWKKDNYLHGFSVGFGLFD